MWRGRSRPRGFDFYSLRGSPARARTPAPTFLGGRLFAYVVATSTHAWDRWEPCWKWYCRIFAASVGLTVPASVSTARTTSPRQTTSAAASPAISSGQHEVDFELRVGSDRFFRAEQHSRAADIFGGALAPVVFSDQPVFQRQVKIETFGAEGRGNLRSRRPLELCWLSEQTSVPPGGVGYRAPPALWLFSAGRVKGFWSRVMPSSSVPLWPMAFSVYPDM